MKRRLFLRLAPAASFLSATALRAQKPEDDPILRAMREELARSRDLKLPGTDPIYYIEYGLDELDTFAASASMGALISANHSRSRIPRVQVRVGDYKFDNTNYIYTDLFARAGGRVVLDDDVEAIRRQFWLMTDQVFKGSLEAIARKRSALRNVTQQEVLNDFSKAEPIQFYLPRTKVVSREPEWKALAKRVSAVFLKHPLVTQSHVELEIAYSNTNMVNSEGTELRFPEDLFFVRIRASAQAADGMPIRDAVVFQARELDKLAAEADMVRGAEQVAGHVEALLKAPVEEDYSGPVLVDDIASPQLFAHLLGANLGMTRRPVSEPGRSFPVPQSELEGRMGSRVLPEWMDAVDDPTRAEWKGEPLHGGYEVDMEGVKPAPLTVVENGKVKNFLLTRLPVRGFEASNGRARLPGSFGAKAAVFSNLFVNAKETVSAADLKKKLIDMIQQRGKPYGLLVRKLDFPTTTPVGEIRRMATASGQRGGSVRPSVAPALTYRVYPDGREELVRGLSFRGLNVRSLRDIAAASDSQVLFHYTGDGSALPAMGAGGYVSTHSVVAPAVLFEDLELEKRQEDWPKLPLAPPPDLTGGQ
ncbi:MAG: metallopeptidase TldD-related protein [Bryobacteraceae bacterium]